MTPGNNGASTPEDEDPFGYLYADGQANGATPPSGGGGYGYPGSVNRVRAVGERQYGQQAQTAPYGQAAYGQQVPQQGYGQPNAHYAAPGSEPRATRMTVTPIWPRVRRWPSTARKAIGSPCRSLPRQKSR